MIAIVNYGSGNIQATINVYNRLGVPVVVAENASQFAGADRYLLPGVGAFDQCMRALNASGMRETLEREVTEAGKPILGICVGMQLLADSSEEGSERGLGWISGAVRRFDDSVRAQGIQLPHMGWNTVEPVRDCGLFADVDLTTGYYFLHSYYFECARESDTLAVADYAGRFAAAVHRDNVFGVQFHPEKSHQAGIQLLKNFSSL